MYYSEEDIKNYCANCDKEYAMGISNCTECYSNLVTYNTRLFTKIFVVQKWERHNKKFKGKMGIANTAHSSNVDE